MPAHPLPNVADPPFVLKGNIPVFSAIPPADGTPVEVGPWCLDTCVEYIPVLNFYCIKISKSFHLMSQRTIST
jgi:hypothetical protein